MGLPVVIGQEAWDRRENFSVAGLLLSPQHRGTLALGQAAPWNGRVRALEPGSGETLWGGGGAGMRCLRVAMVTVEGCMAPDLGHLDWSLSLSPLCFLEQLECLYSHPHCM